MYMIQYNYIYIYAYINTSILNIDGMGLALMWWFVVNSPVSPARLPPKRLQQCGASAWVAYCMANEAEIVAKGKIDKMVNDLGHDT